MDNYYRIEGAYRVMRTYGYQCPHCGRVYEQPAISTNMTPEYCDHWETDNGPVNRYKLQYIGETINGQPAPKN